MHDVLRRVEVSLEPHHRTDPGGLTLCGEHYLDADQQLLEAGWLAELYLAARAAGDRAPADVCTACLGLLLELSCVSIVAAGRSADRIPLLSVIHVRAGFRKLRGGGGCPQE
ncbi:MAG TPA: hypothetical protein ENJ38_00255 [Rhodospirillales bacterium]|nr:hypothetical protein [Rhodospirillales bacterium]